MRKNLLKKLKVTKQSLNRILNDLVKFNIVSFVKDERDSRMKHVYLTKNGEEVFKEIFTSQKKRIYNALIKSSSLEVNNFKSVLKKIINE